MAKTIVGNVTWVGRARVLALGVAVSTALALCLLAWVTVQSANAAFPGKNGKIAFVSNRDAGSGEIYTIGPNGGAATRITFPTGGHADPAYSPDGSRIAFTKSNQIFVMNASGMKPDGTGATQITSTPTAKSQPTWSPDGNKIAYVANSFDVDESTEPWSDFEIWTINANGTGRERLTDNAFPDTQPAWSPLGDKIAFVSARTGDSDRNVYIMNSNGSGQTSITPSSPTGCSPNCYQGNDDFPAWSPDGSKIAYVHGYGTLANPNAGGGVPNIWTMDPNGAIHTNVSDNPNTSATMPAWSPDGTQIAYVGTASGTTNRDIWVMSADGSSQRALHQNDHNDVDPDWQQDSLPPDTTVTSGPLGSVSSTSASLTYVSSESGSSFECSLDNAAFSACSSSKSYTGLANGLHTFSVRATDVAGNVDSTPAVRSWRVDTQAPRGSILINGGSASTARRTVALKLSAKDPAPASGVSHMRFKNNGSTVWSAWQTYSTSKSWSLTSGAGKKTVYVQYKDRAGNLSAAAMDTITYRP